MHKFLDFEEASFNELYEKLTSKFKEELTQLKLTHKQKIYQEIANIYSLGTLNFNSELKDALSLNVGYLHILKLLTWKKNEYFTYHIESFVEVLKLYFREGILGTMNRSEKLSVLSYLRSYKVSHDFVKEDKELLDIVLFLAL